MNAYIPGISKSCFAGMSNYHMHETHAIKELRSGLYIRFVLLNECCLVYPGAFTPWMVSIGNVRKTIFLIVSDMVST